MLDYEYEYEYEYCTVGRDPGRESAESSSSGRCRIRSGQKDCRSDTSLLSSMKANGGSSLHPHSC